MIKTTDTSCKPPLLSFFGIKVLAVMGILLCHAGMFEGFDLCARMVEILFLASGFLMAYNHFLDKVSHDLFEGWRYVLKKLPRFYPVHIVTFLLQLLFVSYWAEKPLRYILSIGCLNLSFLHAWFIGTEFSFNNVSWFLSALLFSYLMTPTISGIVQRFSGTFKGGIKVFMVFLLVRFYLEYLATSEARYVKIDLHCNPFIQTLNFALGYMAGVCYLRKSAFNLYLQEKISFIHLSVLQVLAVVFYFLLCYRFKDEMYRVFFVGVAIPMIYFSAFERGFLGHILSSSLFKAGAAISLEIFMFHSFILYKLPVNGGNIREFLRFFVVTLVVSSAFHFIWGWFLKHLREKNTA